MSTCSFLAQPLQLTPPSTIPVTNWHLMVKNQKILPLKTLPIPTSIFHSTLFPSNLTFRMVATNPKPIQTLNINNNLNLFMTNLNGMRSIEMPYGMMKPSTDHTFNNCTPIVVFRDNTYNPLHNST